jgi:GAF domain-containing protein
MLDEMPILKPLNKPKIMAAHPTIIEAMPFIESHISFKPFIKTIKEKKNNSSGTKERLYNYLIKKFEEEDGLAEEITALGIKDDQAEKLELLATSLFPVVDKNEQINFALATPYQFRVFYYSDEFRKLFFDQHEEYLLLPDGVPTHELKLIQSASVYDHVLEKFYGVHLNEDRHLVYKVSDKETGLLRYYKIRYDRRFINLQLKGTLPPIEDCGVCLNTFRIMDLEKQLQAMPLHLFSAEGFALWIAEDVTTTESLESIKKILLRENCGPEIINDIKLAVKALIGINDIEVGLMPIVTINGQAVPDEVTTAHSILPKQWNKADVESCTRFREYINILKEDGLPVPLSNLDEQMTEIMPFLKYVYDQGKRSYLFYPMQNGDELIGLLELSSPVKNSLTQELIARLEPAMPLLSLAMLKCRDGFNTRIEKLIKEKFTALQQSVEWKFSEVAWDHLRNKGGSDLTKNVVFENVYPLYAAVDIRNSSVERGRCMQQDLKEHLSFIAEILERLQALIDLPLIEGVAFKNDIMRQLIDDQITAEDEVRVNEFLINEVKPLFQHLHKTNDETIHLIDDYFEMVERQDSRLYRHRRNYEASVTSINNAVLAYLEVQENDIQKSYPHYFEKFRTDGLEYNIYIGQSIAPHKPFDILYLKNIRLWQLRSMAEAARITQKLLPALEVPLQTTQLILIHSQPITISFRRDERKFDVEGSYNIRYEVIKKRLDKAIIKDSGERLTQPGKIAMVYSNQKDVNEYEEYIQFLQKKNFLKPGIEMLELDDMQGVRGLKAMRVEIEMEQ